MISHQIPTRKSPHSSIPSCLPTDYSEPDTSDCCLVFSEQDFMHWCSLLTIDELQACFRIQHPEAVDFLRKNCGENSKNWAWALSEQNYLEESLKNLAINTYRKFIQALLLVSEKQYLDSITLNSDCFLFPDKVYKLLLNSKKISDLFEDHHRKQNLPDSSQHKAIGNPETYPQSCRMFPLLREIVEKIQKNLSSKIKQKIHHKYATESSQKTGTFISSFNLYWRYCTEEQKESVWCLGCHDVRKSVCKNLNSLAQDHPVNVQEIEEYIHVVQKIGAKELNDRIFSWKLGRSDCGIVDYMRLVFNLLRDRSSKAQYSPTNKQKNKRSKKKKIRQRMIRRESIDESSNQTNQTDIIYEKTYDINIDELIQSKLEKDITNLSDQINEQANQHYQNRVLAFKRLKNILCCVNIVPKLYGSCCVGLAIKNSDVDVTIDEGVLQQYYGYYGDTLECIAAFFSYLEYYLANFKWISNLKVIKSATIPIIKFTIDNRVKVSQQLAFPQAVYRQMNKEVDYADLVQIDLTVETTQPSRRHLGIISTRQTQLWLDQISSLQPIVIILKYQLAKNALNETYYGGLNTYALLVLIIAVIKHQKLQTQQKISTVLQKVLLFYSQKFEQDKYGIDLNNQQVFYLKNKQTTSSEHQPTKLISETDKDRQLQIKDPEGDHRIITRNCYQFKKIKKIFSDLHTTYFTSTRNKIEEVCSIWNPKENLLDQDSLLEWVENKIREDSGMDMVKME